LFNHKWSGALNGDLDAMLQKVKTRTPDTATISSAKWHSVFNVEV
jgi:hypothetical protein